MTISGGDGVSCTSTFLFLYLYFETQDFCNLLPESGCRVARARSGWGLAARRVSLRRLKLTLEPGHRTEVLGRFSIPRERHGENLGAAAVVFGHDGSLHRTARIRFRLSDT